MEYLENYPFCTLKCINAGLLWKWKNHSSFCTCVLCFQPKKGWLEPIPAVFRWEVGYTMDWSPVNHRVDTHRDRQPSTCTLTPTGSSESLINLLSMFLDCGRENMQTSHRTRIRTGDLLSVKQLRERSHIQLLAHMLTLSLLCNRFIWVRNSLWTNLSALCLLTNPFSTPKPFSL